jgi:hypothetical protein
MRRATWLVALAVSACAMYDAEAPPPAEQSKEVAAAAPASRAAGGEADRNAEPPAEPVVTETPGHRAGQRTAGPSPSGGSEVDELLGALDGKSARAGRRDALDARRPASGGDDDVRAPKQTASAEKPRAPEPAPSEREEEADDGDASERQAAGEDQPAPAARLTVTAEKVERPSEGKKKDKSRDGDRWQQPADSQAAAKDAGDDAWRAAKPTEFLPRFGYFENTYLGGDAAWAERLRRLDAALPEGQRPYLSAALAPQPFDPPGDAGLGVSAQLDVGHVERPGRVLLQVGLQGSARYGWRRPPLDVVLVADVEPALVDETLLALVRRLGAQDRLGLVAPGLDVALAPPAELRRTLGARLGGRRDDAAVPLGDAVRRAGALLADAAGDEARVPGTQLVLVLTAGDDPARVDAAADAAHALSVQGAVTSVLEAGDGGAWWPVASAGHGSYHHLRPGAALATVDAELEAVARVVARLVRVNVRLAPGVEAVRVVGSRLLAQQEVAFVKAREVATDRNLSRTLGVQADRGDDDDGLQTVVPYFLGGDAHVVLIELWVERPGPVADVTVRYKDMVSLTNATARASVSLAATPRPETPFQRAVRGNLRGFEVAAALGEAAAWARRGDTAAAIAALDRARPLAHDARDARVLDGFADLLRRDARPVVADALDLARARRIGLTAHEGAR